MSVLPCTVLILAGQRAGGDPVALAAGVERKAFAPVAGIPMLLRVADAIRQAMPGCLLAIALDRPEEGEARSMLGDLARGGPVMAAPMGASPCGTVAAVLDVPHLTLPLLVTTADHALLTPEMVGHFLSHVPEGADVAAGVATREVISAAYPDTRRTYWRFRDRAVSGCNLFYLGPDGAAKAVAFWRRLEQDRKRPWAMLRHLGWTTVLRFALGRLTLAEALRRMSARIGATVAVVELPFAEAAMDVDRPADLALAEAIIGQRPLGGRPFEQRPLGRCP